MLLGSFFFRGGRTFGPAQNPIRYEYIFLFWEKAMTLIAMMLFLAGCFVTLVLLFIVLLLIRSCLRVVLPRRLLSGMNANAIIVAAGVTAVLFNDTVTILFRGLIKFVLDAFWYFSNTIGRLLDADFTHIRNVLELLGTEMKESVSRLLNTLDGIGRDLSFPALLAALACFVVLANAISSGGQGNSLLLSLRSWYADLRIDTRHRIALGWVVLAGVYLSLAAIIAIPWLQDIDSDHPAQETELRQRLLTATGTREEFENRWPPTIAVNDLLEGLGPKIDSLTEPPGGDMEKTPPSPYIPPIKSGLVSVSITKLKNYYNNVMSDRDYLRGQWRIRREKALTDRDRLMEVTIETYDRYRDAELSARERQVFADDLVRWFRAGLSRIDERLRSFHSATEWRNEDWRRWAQEVSDQWDALAENNLIEVWRPADLKAFGTMDDVGPDLGLPPPPRDVAGLGIFGFFANWLVMTRSLPLALICGMIGFGLFGSVVSRALVSGVTSTGVSATGHTMDVLLVGVSAAVIIFLASQGGLAIFSTGDLRPNPYILFLACFVGAAYGDHVWASARERLLQACQEPVNGEKSAEGVSATTTPDKKDQKEPVDFII